MTRNVWCRLLPAHGGVHAPLPAAGQDLDPQAHLVQPPQVRLRLHTPMLDSAQKWTLRTSSCRVVLQLQLTLSSSCVSGDVTAKITPGPTRPAIRECPDWQPLLPALLETPLACSIWKDAQVQQELYRYYKPETRGLDQEGLLDDLSKGSPGDVVLLHACAHNPTGVFITLTFSLRSAPRLGSAAGRHDVYSTTPAAAG